MVLEMNLRWNKKVILQISLTVITFIITILLPIVGYFQFSRILTDNSLCSQCPTYQMDLENLQVRYNFIFITLILIGVILTILRYSIYKFPQYSIKQGFLNLLNSIFFVLFLSIIAQLGIINISLEGFSLSLNLTGVFLLIIAVWSLFIIKNVFDLYDFKKNRIYYENLLRSTKSKSKRS